jgi:hypothetical protein
MGNFAVTIRALVLAVVWGAGCGGGDGPRVDVDDASSGDAAGTGDAAAVPDAGDGGGGPGVDDAACLTQLSCVVLSGAGRDSAWLMQRRSACEAFGFGRTDAPGTWQSPATCPDADYFASCIEDDEAEHHLLVSFDTDLAQMEMRCVNSGGTWQRHESVDPKALNSIDDALIQPEVVSTLHPDVVTVALAQFCSTGVPDGTVGVTESYNDATNLSRYFHFVCIDGTGYQAPFHFTQARTERYTQASEVPGHGLKLVILSVRDHAYFVTGDTCWNCGASFTLRFPNGVGTSNEVGITDTAGVERLVALTTVSL